MAVHNNLFAVVKPILRQNFSDPRANSAHLETGGIWMSMVQLKSPLGDGNISPDVDLSRLLDQRWKK
jgi:hypothetical protein